MPSRRETIAMTEEEIDEYLREGQTLIIVSNGPNGYPHPMPMWYWVDEAGCLYCTSFEKSQKVTNFRRDPRAALLVESGHVYADLKSVVIYARAEVIDDYDRVVDCLVNINTRGRVLDEVETAELREAVAATARKRSLLKFVPERYVSWDHNKLAGKY